MDYTKESGSFYKVIENGKPTSVGRLEGINQLSTIHEVIFITKEEYTELTGIEVVEVPETVFPDYFGAAPENQPEEPQEEKE